MYVHSAQACLNVCSLSSSAVCYFAIILLLSFPFPRQGEFVGGCDIVMGMFASGELHKLLGKQPPAAAAAAEGAAKAK